MTTAVLERRDEPAEVYVYARWHWLPNRGEGGALPDRQTEGAEHTEQSRRVKAEPPGFTQPLRALGPPLRRLSRPEGSRRAGARQPHA